MNRTKKVESAQARINKILLDLCEEGFQVRAVVNWIKNEGECKIFGKIHPQIKLTLMNTDGL